MPSEPFVTVSKKAVWSGRILSGVLSFLLFADTLGKFIRPAPVVEGTAKLGYQEGVILPLGVVLFVCVVLYAIPRTAVLGAILLTGYLGGAVASHVRVGDPLATHALFPVYIGILLWLGLYLRDPRVRALAPIRS